MHCIQVQQKINLDAAEQQAIGAFASNTAAAEIDLGAAELEVVGSPCGIWVH